MSRLLLLLALPITLSIALYKPYKDFSSPDMASLSALRASAGKFPGRKALVVGGTSGLGEGIAVRLAKAEFDVLIAGRNAEAGRRVVEEMERARDGNGTPGSFKFEKLDASVLANVKEFTEEYEKKEGKLDVLVLTQGIASLAGRTETAEGVDVKMSLHYCEPQANELSVLC